GQSAHLEPTCLALLALAPHRARFPTAIDQGLAFLARCARPDGTYRLAHGRDEAVWPTSLVLFTRAALGVPAAELRPSVAVLLGLRGRAQDDKEAAEGQDIDLKLIGWPWGEGNLSLAETTPWAWLALGRRGDRSM